MNVGIKILLFFYEYSNCMLGTDVGSGFGINVRKFIGEEQTDRMAGT